MRMFDRRASVLASGGDGQGGNPKFILRRLGTQRDAGTAQGCEALLGPTLPSPWTDDYAFNVYSAAFSGAVTPCYAMYVCMVGTLQCADSTHTFALGPRQGLEDLRGKRTSIRYHPELQRRPVSQEEGSGSFCGGFSEPTHRDRGSADL